MNIPFNFVLSVSDPALLQRYQSHRQNRPAGRREHGPREVVRREPEVPPNRQDGAHLSVLQRILLRIQNVGVDLGQEPAGPHVGDMHCRRGGHASSLRRGVPSHYR